MIELKQLAAELETQLNTGLTGDIEYKLFTDTGSFQKAYRERNSVTTIINGIYSNVSSDVSNVFTDDGGYIVASMTNEVVLVIPCKDDDESVYSVIHRADGTTEQELVETGNNDFIAQIRKRLDDIAAQTLYFTLKDTSEKVYDISVAFQLADTGMREQLPELGDCFTFSLQGFYNIIESGDNSRKWKIYLDNMPLPYSSMSLQRQTTPETTVYANRGRSTSTLIVADTFSCGIEIPSLLMGFNEVVKDFLLNGSNGYAHVAKFVAGDTTAYKLVVLAESTATASGVLNVGEKLQLNETNEEYGLIAFSSDYYDIYRCSATSIGVKMLSWSGDFLLLYRSTNRWQFFTGGSTTGGLFFTGGSTTRGFSTGALAIVKKGDAFTYTNSTWTKIQGD